VPRIRKNKQAAMNFEEIVQIFNRAKALVRNAATRGMRVAVMTDANAEPTPSRSCWVRARPSRSSASPA
jgi:hypothetical protein